MSIDLQKDVRYLKGVGEVRSRLLLNMEIKTVHDLLTYYPQRYEDRRKIRDIAMINDGDTALIKGEVTGHKQVYLRGKKNLLKINIKDKSGIMALVCFNQLYLKEVLKSGTIVFVHGKFSRTKYGLETSNYTYEKVKENKDVNIHTGRIVPIYKLTSGINQKWLRGIIHEAADKLEGEFLEFLPGSILKKENIWEINRSVKSIHFPAKLKDIQKARKRLILGEFLLFQTALAIKKMNTRKIKKDRSYNLKKDLLTPFREKLGFEFTKDQKKTINEIFNDMLSEYPMKRLLQGEVGSGKTVVALSAILLAVENSYQGVIIAPTEILAEQHYMTFKSYLRGLGVKVDLLVGNLKKAKRERILKSIESGKTNIIVGTHALLQEDVNLSGAGIIVIDEQHRFGVRQKAVLSGKSISLDVLAMSATPIPRTLAMCSYGDLDISTIKELPADRKTPVTEYISEIEAYKFAVDELNKKKLVYIVHPLIEESDKSELKSVEEGFNELKETVFKDYPCGLLHGRLAGEAKEGIMKDFAAKKYRVLFTTTVIEVGIDIPEATVMIIENFNRYGLATLHQLRGRIARSSSQAYCFLTGKVTTPESRKRLNVILSTDDGFKIAEEDLKLRGGGELFGTRQHGIVDFKLGDPVLDFPFLVKARKMAFDIINSDGKLAKRENRVLKKVLYREFGSKFHLADIS
ncbi:ATP-dependent DNA helicase RecG [Elusimicrobiota bacterium]